MRSARESEGKERKRKRRQRGNEEAEALPRSLESAEK